MQEDFYFFYCLLILLFIQYLFVPGGICIKVIVNGPSMYLLSIIFFSHKLDKEFYIVCWLIIYKGT